MSIQPTLKRSRAPGCRVVFEACMDWHWLMETLEGAMPREKIVLANPFKTRRIRDVGRVLQGRGRRK